MTELVTRTVSRTRIRNLEYDEALFIVKQCEDAGSKFRPRLLLENLVRKASVC